MFLELSSCTWICPYPTEIVCSKT